MTEERLRGKVSYGKTVNLGKVLLSCSAISRFWRSLSRPTLLLLSARVDWSEDFFLDDGVPIEVLTLQLKDRLEKWLKENGLTA